MSGFVLRKTIIEAFRAFFKLHMANLSSQDETKYMAQFNSYFINTLNKLPDIGQKHVGEHNIFIFLYKMSKFSDKSLSSIVDILIENKTLKSMISNENDGYSIKEIQNMIKEQVKLFNTVSSDFDYRTIFNDISQVNFEQNYFLHQYLHKPLVEFFDRVFNTDEKSKKRNHKDRLHLQLVIGILANIMNKNCIVIQTLLGLLAYAGGLRDKMFDIFSKFGICCSLEHIRVIQENWSKKRNILNEVDKSSFWRVTFDNLNFLRKFANVCVLWY